MMIIKSYCVFIVFKIQIMFKNNVKVFFSSLIFTLIFVTRIFRIEKLSLIRVVNEVRLENLMEIVRNSGHFINIFKVSIKKMRNLKPLKYCEFYLNIFL